jgi:tetratricopeptide (TPR) repeat protein
MKAINHIEELFLEADKALDEGNLAEGKKLLEEILREEPSYGKAHNHLGWLYKTRFQDYNTAETHYKLALKFDPDYSATYLNYAYLLRDSGRLDELEQILTRALNINAPNKCGIYDEFGSLYELRGQYKQAIKYYKKAIQHCLNDKILEELKGHIKRCRKKRSMFGKFKRMIEYINI